MFVCKYFCEVIVFGLVNVICIVSVFVEEFL